VFRYAIAHGLATRNPAADIKPSDVLASRQKKNLARIDGKELPQLLRHIDAYRSGGYPAGHELDGADLCPHFGTDRGAVG
jgi:hypothetical protein